MSSTTETGHAKNVANFHNLIDFFALVMVETTILLDPT